ncbi:hypothetical protein YYC_03538 [Plasmodium yoelii 17X]|uniref:Uncharacterized protein n=2 Tax=Plasmodium yoelii TaxID=5861 RepID=Q7RPK2_PLAYO|nr:hypothetical protein [Plasmodium yoelii yoelii]ETB58713.1 hypothetical protein YYC_03538 [Plasmodium yoelii 17X]
MVKLQIKSKFRAQIIILNMFYTQYIEIDVKYITPIENGTIYNICKNLINNKKELVNINIKDMFTFYDIFKMLYTMYGNYNEYSSDTTSYL